MYRMTVITAIGNYVVEIPPGKEDPTNNELMEQFYQVRNDFMNGCFMEGWGPNDNLNGPPGVFAIHHTLEVFAFEISKVVEISTIPMTEETKDTVLPETLNLSYLGNNLRIKMVYKYVGDYRVCFLYDVNGEAPTDVLEASKMLSITVKGLVDKYKENENHLVIQVSDHSQPMNFSQAAKILENICHDQKIFSLHGMKGSGGKAWNGWKGDDE